MTEILYLYIIIHQTMASEAKKVMKIAVPSTIAWLGHIGYHLVNNILIGKIIGAEGLATAGIASSMYLMVLMFGLGASTVIVALISSLNNRHNIHKMPATFQNALVFCTIIGVLMSVILYLLAPVLIPFVNKQPSINHEAINFLRIISVTFITTMIFYAFQRLCEGIGNSRPTMYTTIFCNVTNGIMSYVFLTGSLGMPKIGIYGPAISAVVNGILEIIIIFIIILRNPILTKVIEFRKLHLSLEELKHISAVAIPAGLFIFFEGCSFSLAAFFASRVSIEAISAHQINLWLLTTILIPVFGLCSAIVSRIAFNYSNFIARPRVRNSLIINSTIRSIVISVVYGFFMMGLVYIFREPLLRSILKNSVSAVKVIEIMNSVLFLMIVFIIFDITQMLLANVLRAFHDTLVPSVFALISYWGIGIPLSYVLGIKCSLGVLGIWGGLSVGLLTAALLFLGRFIIIYRSKLAITSKTA